NTGPKSYGNSSDYRTHPCGQGVTSAAAAKAAGTVIYTIGYDLDAGNANVCTSWDGSPEPGITAVGALTGIASPSDFVSQPDPGSLSGVYRGIAADILSPNARLIPDSTQ